MPKVNHRRGGGGDAGKHISSFEEVKARNSGKLSAYDKARAIRNGDTVEAESDEEEPQQAVQKPRGQSGVQGLIATENPNAVKRDEVKEGVELSRKQREEIERQAARRRYEELHKAGKTDEAKADLARLEEVKKRREEALKKKAEAEEEAKKAAEKPKNNREALNAELKDIIKGPSKDEGAAEEGKAEKGSYADCVKVEEGKAVEKKKTMDGSIGACREAEEDFM